MERKINWSSRSNFRGPKERTLGEFLGKLFDRFSPQSNEVSITYVDKIGMRKLVKGITETNRQPRLMSIRSSSEQAQMGNLGEIVICLEIVCKNAKTLRTPVKNQVFPLILRGFLHLCGYELGKGGSAGSMVKVLPGLEKELLPELVEAKVKAKKVRKAWKRRFNPDGSKKVSQAALLRQSMTEEEWVAHCKKKKAEALKRRDDARNAKAKAKADADVARAKAKRRKKRPSAKIRTGVIA